MKLGAKVIYVIDNRCDVVYFVWRIAINALKVGEACIILVGNPDIFHNYDLLKILKAYNKRFSYKPSSTEKIKKPRHLRFFMPILDT